MSPIVTCKTVKVQNILLRCFLQILCFTVNDLYFKMHMNFLALLFFLEPSHYHDNEKHTFK